VKIDVRRIPGRLPAGNKLGRGGGSLREAGTLLDQTYEVGVGLVRKEDRNSSSMGMQLNGQTPEAKEAVASLLSIVKNQQSTG